MKGCTYKSTWISALAIVFTAGCGGGQGGGSGAQSTHTSKAGEAVFTYFGQPKPLLTTSAGQISVLAQAGAVFSNVTLEPPPNLQDTYLVLSRNNGGEYGLYKVNYSNLGSEKPLYSTTSQALRPGISAYGTVCFINTNSLAGTTPLYSVRQDGTALSQISFSNVDNNVLGAGRYSVDGTNRLAFQSPSGLFIGPGTGGTATIVQSSTNELGLEAWNPSGTELAYAAPIGPSGDNDVFITSTSGGSPTDVTPTALRGTGSFSVMGWAPDGITLLATYLPSGSTAKALVKFTTADPIDYLTITPSGDSDLEAALSPDGNTIAFYRSAINSQSPGIYTCDINGLNQSLVLADPSSSTADGGISWSPFMPKETVVASSGSTFYRQAASGFLLSQNGGQFGSMVAFTAGTPADAAIQAPTSTSPGASLIYTLTADSITSVAYINSYFSSGTTLTLTSTPTVVVTVDSVTGQIDLVAPAATAKPSITKNPDGTITYNAQFKAVYDGHGKNLAPSGASKLVADPKTGRLVSLS